MQMPQRRSFSHGFRYGLGIVLGQFGQRLLERLEQPMASGIGLANVRERLRVIFGATYHLTLASEPGQGTIARIEVPQLVTADSIHA